MNSGFEGRRAGVTMEGRRKERWKGGRRGRGRGERREKGE